MIEVEIHLLLLFYIFEVKREHEDNSLMYSF